MPSSILISMICAPFSTCCLATSDAASKSSSLISRENLGDPVTLVRSPTLMKPKFSVKFKGSRPLNRQVFSKTGISRGLYLSATFFISRICSGVVPQQPPTILSHFFCRNISSTAAISEGVSSYPPNALGRPALG